MPADSDTIPWAEATLEEIVASLREGDKIRATYEGGGGYPGYATEGSVYKIGAVLYVGGNSVVHDFEGTPWKGLVSVKILERAERPFYTNQPASRKPRIGDVWENANYGEPGSIREPRLRRVFLGDGWASSIRTGDGSMRGVAQMYDIEPGVGRLVDPSELESSDG